MLCCEILLIFFFHKAFFFPRAGQREEPPAVRAHGRFGVQSGLQFLVPSGLLGPRFRFFAVLALNCVFPFSETSGDHFRQDGTTVHRFGAAADGSELPGHRHSPRHGAGGAFISLPAV